MTTGLGDLARIFGWPALLQTLVKPHQRGWARHRHPDLRVVRGWRQA